MPCNKLLGIIIIMDISMAHDHNPNLRRNGPYRKIQKNCINTYNGQNKTKNKQNKFKKEKEGWGHTTTTQTKQANKEQKQTNKQKRKAYSASEVFVTQVFTFISLGDASQWPDCAFFKDSDTGWPFRPNKVCRLVPLDFLLLNLIVSNGEWGLISLGRPTGGR